MTMCYVISNKLYVNNIADYGVCFCRLMSQLADVNSQPSVGMFTFDNVSLILTDLVACVFVHYCSSWIAKSNHDQQSMAESCAVSNTGILACI